jgi:hypothetical protein
MSLSESAALITRCIGRIGVLPYRHMSVEREATEPKPLFALGEVVATPGAVMALGAADQSPLALLARHVTGDWGELDEHDQRENAFSVKHGLRILSAYTLETGVKLWLITEADRSVTTFLLPEEY